MSLSALSVVGLSHQTAPLELREKLSFSIQELEKALPEIQKRTEAKELVVLSTCNRTEIYASSENALNGSAMGFLNRGGEKINFQNFLYEKTGQEVAQHLFRVAAGLDSMVLGENEILKQVKDAYHLSQKIGLTGKVFNILFQRALYVGKLVRTHTLIGQGSTSVGSVAVALAEKIFGGLSESTVLIFGAGKMAEVSARYLLSKKVKKLLVANRTVENAEGLAKKFDARPLSLEQGMEQMAQADIVISSVSVPQPILSKEFVNGLMLRRRNRSLFLIDIAVPRNVDPSVHQLDNVYLYNIDDLQTMVRKNIKNRSAEIEKAARLAEQKGTEFFEWYRSFKSGDEKSFKHRVAHNQQDISTIRTLS